MCRNYQDRPVPRVQLVRVLEAARRSPSAGHSQGVRFAVITRFEQRKRVAEAFGEPKFLARGFQPWLSKAPVHLVVAVSKQAYKDRYSAPDKRGRGTTWPVPYPILDCGKALMSLYLAAGEFGLSCGYLGPHAGPDLVELFELPSEWRFTGLVTLGYARQTQAKTTSALRGWRPFDEVVRWL